MPTKSVRAIAVLTLVTMIIVVSLLWYAFGIAERSAREADERTDRVITVLMQEIRTTAGQITREELLERIDNNEKKLDEILDHLREGNMSEQQFFPDYNDVPERDDDEPEDAGIEHTVPVQDLPDDPITSER